MREHGRCHAPAACVGQLDRAVARTRRCRARELVVRHGARGSDCRSRSARAGRDLQVPRRDLALARGVGYDEITMFWFPVGALLHDVGKIVVPSEILNKPGPLTPDERLTMEQHAAAGSDLLREVDFPWDVLPLVRGHHERWDGR